MSGSLDTDPSGLVRTEVVGDELCVHVLADLTAQLFALSQFSCARRRGQIIVVRTPPSARNAAPFVADETGLER